MEEKYYNSEKKRRYKVILLQKKAFYNLNKMLFLKKKHSLNSKDTQEITNSDCLWTRGNGMAGDHGEKMSSFFIDICPYVKMTRHICMQLCSTMENGMGYQKSNSGVKIGWEFSVSDSQENITIWKKNAFSFSLSSSETTRELVIPVTLSSTEIKTIFIRHSCCRYLEISFMFIVA